MKSIILIIILFFSLNPTAQSQNGESKFISYLVTAKSFLNFDEVIDMETYWKDVAKIATTKNKITVTSKREAIKFENPHEFLAFSCRWYEEEKSNLKIYIRFSNKSNESKDGFVEIKKDEHYEGKEDYQVSNLQFLDKEITHYELKAVANATKNGIFASSLFLNFFNPFEKETHYIEDWNLLDSRKSTAFFETNQTNDVNQTEQTQACPCNLPTYTTRTQWNCPQGQGLVSGVGTSAAVTHLVVHHSAGNNTATDWNAVILSIWNFHTGTNGYSDIGYNWLITPNGQLYEGRGSNSLTQNVTGAHFCGTNAGTMGVCMVGTYTSVDITTAARATLAKLLAWKCCQANIPPIGIAAHASSGLMLNRISGHRDGCATDCPGTTFYNTLPTLRNAVQDSINACSTAPPPCAVSLNITATGCPNNTITFTPSNVQNGGTAPTYSWFLNNTQVATGNSYVLSNAANGDKVFAIMTSNATCIAATQPPVNSDTITLNCIVTTPVISVDGLEYLRIAPNPNNGNFSIQMQLNQSKQVQYTILNAEGKNIYTSNKERLQGNIIKPIQIQVAKGIYFLEIYFDGKKIVRKIVIN